MLVPGKKLAESIGAIWIS